MQFIYDTFNHLLKWFPRQYDFKQGEKILYSLSKDDRKKVFDEYGTMNRLIYFINTVQILHDRENENDF